MNWKDRLWKAFNESIIIQSATTMMFGLTLCALWIIDALNPDLNVVIPGELYTFNGLMLGYWFKTKEALAERKKLELEVQAASIRPG